VITLSQVVSHHVLRVVMVPRGSTLVLFDGQGREATGELIGTQDGLAQVRLTEDPRVARPGHALVLVVGLPRKPAWDHGLRMATELGATEIRGFPASRSVGQGGKPERWTRVVEAAAAQCGRGHVPRVRACPDLATALEDLPDQRLVGVPGVPPTRAPRADTALLIGPEGGLTDLELARARREGFTPFGLSPWTLRVDTAIAAALALIGAAHRPGHRS